MLTLPPVAPVTGWHSSVRLPWDHYIRLGSNDYSVHPQVIGRRVKVTADLHRVRVWCDGQLVADHERVWARHQTISDPEHVQAGADARAAWRLRSSARGRRPTMTRLMTPLTCGQASCPSLRALASRAHRRGCGAAFRSRTA